jgi:hypothetical protein
VERRCFSTYLPRERKGGEGRGRREEEGEEEDLVEKNSHRLVVVLLEY